MTLADPAAPKPLSRSALRAVALPNEHGGWGLTAEPVLLGLLIAPSLAGTCLGLATVLAFLLRTPVRVVLVDRHRGRSLDRTRLARLVAGGEAALIIVLVVLAALTADGPFWWPAVIAAPLVGIELSYDMRSRSRRLVPELAGAVGVSAAAAMIVVAAGQNHIVATGAWLILAARAVTAIPHVRHQIALLHHRPASANVLLAADATAVVLALAAVAVSRAYLAGAVAVAALIALQRLTGGRSTEAKAIGIRQTVLGLVVVLVTAAGTHLA